MDTAIATELFDLVGIFTLKEEFPQFATLFPIIADCLVSVLTNNCGA